MSRPSKDEWCMKMAYITSLRSTCYRRNVGCVLVNKNHHIIATGYNGVAKGLPHCNEVDVESFNPNPHPFLCEGAHAKSGEKLNQCQAIHAEQNALLQCPDVQKIMTCYVTVSPCITCTKLLLNTSCQRIVYLEEYAHNDAAKTLWLKSNRHWSQINLPDQNLTIARTL